MKLFFSLLIIMNVTHARDLFVVSGPKGAEEFMKEWVSTINKMEEFTQDFTVKRITNKCIPDRDALIHICIDRDGIPKMVYSNDRVLNNLFKDFNKDAEISN